jgi:hypothetical protein
LAFNKKPTSFQKSMGSIGQDFFVAHLLMKFSQLLVCCTSNIKNKKDVANREISKWLKNS